jgi:predicted nucleotide-binding protein
MYTSIRESDIFIADLTGLRPNVMVELGYALHYIGKKRVIIIHQTVDADEKVPFDLNDFRYRQFSDTGEMTALIKPDLEEIINRSELGEI